MYFWWFLFQTKQLLTFWIFKESNIWQRFIIFTKMRFGVNYCWNYGPLKLLLYLVEYPLDQLNSKHTKIAANSAIQYFEGCSQNKCLLKVWSFLVYPTQNGGPVKFLQNWTEIIFYWPTFSNLTNIRHLVWWKCIICAKSDLPIKCSVC